MNKLLKLIIGCPSLSVDEIAKKLGEKKSVVEKSFKQLEKDGTVLGFRPIINQEKVEIPAVEAMIEIHVHPERGEGFDGMAKRIARFSQVHGVFLVSGSHDLNVMVCGKSLREVAAFVSDKLATLPRVESTQTNFLLKKYKEGGIQLFKDEKVERLVVSA